MSNYKGSKREKLPVLKRIDVYQEFILWSAMPPAEKARLGIESQTEFCKHYGIGHNTPTAWKHRPDFEEKVDKILRVWAMDRTPDVVQGIYRAAVKGNPMSQLLWLQYFKKFNPKQEVQHTHTNGLGIGDLRNLIDTLPEDLKQEHYANLRKLLSDVNAARSAGRIEDAVWTARPAITVPKEAYIDAQGVSDDKADDVPRRYKGSVRADMVGQEQAHNHQGTAWRGEE